VLPAIDDDDSFRKAWAGVALYGLKKVSFQRGKRMSKGEQTWRTRLTACLEKDGSSLRSISLQAGLGANYLSQMINDNKEPGIEIVLRLCNILNVSVTYIVTGKELSKLDEELLVLLADVDVEAKIHLRDFLRNILAGRGNLV
jgi:transcriptional regulator with XRE-family HTH domain